MEPERRRFVRSLAAAGTAGLAGCAGVLDRSGDETEGDDSPDGSSPSGSTADETGTDTTGDGGSQGGTIQPDSDWPSFQGDRRNTGGAATPTGPASSPSVAWEVTADDEARGDPVVADGLVLASSWDGRLYAVAPDGTREWTFESDSGTLGRPAAASGGYAFVGDDGGNVYALSLDDGQPAWTTSLDLGSLRGGVVLANGTLYAPVQDHLVALDAATGAERWRFRAADPVAATPAVADSTVYAPSLDGYLYAVSAGGDERWKTRVSEQGGLPDPTVATVGGTPTVFVGWGDGVLYAFDARDGSERWTRRIGGAASVAVADGRVYHAGYDVEALDPATGDPVWSVEGPDGITRPITVGDDGLYVGGGTTVLSLSTDGEVRWRTGTEYEVATSPALVDGRLVYGDEYGHVVGLA